MLGFLSCHLCLVFEDSSFVLVAQKAPASSAAPSVSFWALENWWLPKVWKKHPGLPYFSHSSVHGVTGVTFLQKSENICLLHVHFSPSFPYYLFYSIIYLGRAVGTLCKSLLRPVTRDCVPSKGFIASALAPRAICAFPCAKGTEENQRTGNKWSAAIPGCCRGAWVLPWIVHQR